MTESEKPLKGSILGGRTALLLINIQNDFVNGECAISGADKIIPIVNQLREKIPYSIVIVINTNYSTDRPSFTFLSAHLENKNVTLGTEILYKPTNVFTNRNNNNANTHNHNILNGLNGPMKIKLMKQHCVQNQHGSLSPASLALDKKKDFFVFTGQDPDVPVFSGFFDANGSPTAVENILKENTISDVHIAGLTDSCVYSAIHSASLGFRTTYIIDGVALPPVSSLNGATLFDLHRSELERLSISLNYSQNSFFDSKGESIDSRSLINAYLNSHNLPELMNKLCSALIYFKPSDPRAFIVKQLQTLRQNNLALHNSKQTTAAPAPGPGPLGKPQATTNEHNNNNIATATSPQITETGIALFTDEDFETMFRMLDPLNRGSLSVKQVSRGLMDLGLEESRAEELMSKENSSKRFSKEDFKLLCHSHIVL